MAACRRSGRAAFKEWLANFGKEECDEEFDREFRFQPKKGKVKVVEQPVKAAEQQPTKKELAREKQKMAAAQQEILDLKRQLAESKKAMEAAVASKTAASARPAKNQPKAGGKGGV